MAATAVTTRFALLIAALRCLSAAPTASENDIDGRAGANQLNIFGQELKRLKADMQSIQATAHANSPTGGTTYVRWGRTTCGSTDAETIYTGFVAGAHKDQGGSGSNHLCLHESPQWMAKGNFANTIYGVEFKLDKDTDVFSTRNNGGTSLVDFPSPCVACHVPSRGAVIMIPARTQCPTGWMYEYRGYMVSDTSLSNHHRSEYACWDEAPESAVGSTNQNQAVIYPLKVQCGSLPCSRFSPEKALTCIVCTK